MIEVPYSFSEAFYYLQKTTMSGTLYVQTIKGVKSMGNMSFGEYTKTMLAGYIGSITLIYVLIDISEARSYVVSVFAIVFVLINLLQFVKYKEASLYKIKMSVVWRKEPSMIYLGLAGLALGFLSDSSEPLILAIFISCAMLNLKYILMHLQLAAKLRGETE